MNAGKILSTIPPIVQNIFRYLCRQDLDSCSKVCELWKHEAEYEKSRRNDVFCFFQDLPCNDLNYRRDRRYLVDTIGNTIQQILTTKTKDLMVTPTFCLIVCKDGYKQPISRLNSIQEYKRNKKKNLESCSYEAILNPLRQHLPEKCNIIFCVTTRIVGWYGESAHFATGGRCAISGIIIPHVPGLLIYNIPIDEEDISKIIPDSVEIKCLLLFGMKYLCCYSKIINGCRKRKNSHFAVGGIIMDHTEPHHTGSAVAFCGENVEAASVVIRSEDANELEKKLRHFERTGLLKYRCFAFMFASMPYGNDIYNKLKLQSSIFHKFYPEVPLIAVAGGEEVGTDYLPNVPDDTRNIRLRKTAATKWEYQNPTVFVLLSVKL